MSRRAIIGVKVNPRASCDEIVGWHGGALKVRIAAPPVDGKANDALRALLAKRLGLRVSAVSIAAGAGSAYKRVAIDGLTVDEIERRLGPASSDDAER
jgi:uncharacterized protein